MKTNYANSNIKESFLAILPSQIFSFITSSLSGIVNGLVIGNYLTNLDMIALGFVSPVVQIISVFSAVISSGARIVCGRFIGRGEKEKINDAFTTAINSLVVIGLLLTFIGLLFAKQIALIISNEDALSNTILYIRGISIGIIPTIIVPCLMVFLQMKNHTTYALVSTVLLAVINLILDLIGTNFIGVDIFGIGLITSISQYLVMIFMIIKFITSKDLPRLKKGKTGLYKKIIIIGMPSALITLLYALRNSTINKLGASFGNDVVNALSILNSSCGPFDAVNIGVARACLMLASIYIGERDKDSLKTLYKVTCKYGIILGFIKIVIIFVLRKNIALAYGAVGEAIDLTSSLYFAYSLTMPINMVACSLMNIYQSFGKIKYCNILSILTAYILPIGFAVIFKNLLGYYAIWYCYLVPEFIILLIMYIYACYKKKRIINNLEDVICIDSNFGKIDHLNMSIKTTEEVTMVSKKVQDFCLNKNLDKNKSMLAGLCLEEMSANIVEHGFTKSKKKNKTIDIFVSVDNDEVNIRIKDNAVPFDPHIKLNNDDITKNIGIRMVAKIAKDMNYQNTFGLNVLSITL